jgi:hypothetical protein
LSDGACHHRPFGAWRKPLPILATISASAILTLCVGCGGTVASPDEGVPLPTKDAGTSGASDASVTADATDASTSSDVTTVDEIAVEAGCEASGDAAITVSPGLLAFGDGGFVACGTQAPPLSVTITNHTCASEGFTVELPTGMTYYTLSPSFGTLGPGATQAVQVTAAAVPVTAGTQGYPGTLSVTTTSGEGAQLVSLKTDAYGAIMECPDFGSLVDFGAVPVGQSVQHTLGITNAGLAPTTLSFSVLGNGFTVTASDGGPATSIPADPGIGVLVLVTLTPTAVESYTGTVYMNLAPGTPQCEQPLGPAYFSGKGM